MKIHFGRHIYGFAAIAIGIITIVGHQINSLGNISHPEVLVCLVAAVEVIGGLAIQWPRTEKYGAITLSTVYFIFSLFLIPFIVSGPLEYDNWGNFFEEFSIVLGGTIAFASTIQSDQKKKTMIEKFAYRFFGICVISYALYQLFYLSYTADLVPKWMPPSQMFWAVITTIAFALAAFAIISGRSALLAARLLTVMLICFSLFVWVTASIIDMHELSNWFRNAQTLAVAGSVWIVADFLSQQKINHKHGD